VEQRTPGKSRLSSTLIASYAILLDGKMIEYHLFDVKVIAFSKLIGNCFTDVSILFRVVVVAVGVSEVELIVLEI